MIPMYELHPGSFIKSPTGTGIAVWTIGNYEGIEKEFTVVGWVYKVEPEDITPEILEKLGFQRIPEFSETHWEYKLNIAGQELIYHCGTSSLYLWPRTRFTVIYLHQLQNLWICITGKELKYNP